MKEPRGPASRHETASEESPEQGLPSMATRTSLMHTFRPQNSDRHLMELKGHACTILYCCTTALSCMTVQLTPERVAPGLMSHTRNAPARSSTMMPVPAGAWSSTARDSSMSTRELHCPVMMPKVWCTPPHACDSADVKFMRACSAHEHPTQSEQTN